MDDGLGAPLLTQAIRSTTGGSAAKTNPPVTFLWPAMRRCSAPRPDLYLNDLDPDQSASVMAGDILPRLRPSKRWIEEGGIHLKQCAP